MAIDVVEDYETQEQKLPNRAISDSLEISRNPTKRALEKQHEGCHIEFTAKRKRPSVPSAVLGHPNFSEAMTKPQKRPKTSQRLHEKERHVEPRKMMDQDDDESDEVSIVTPKLLEKTHRPHSKPGGLNCPQSTEKQRSTKGQENHSKLGPGPPSCPLGRSMQTETFRHKLFHCQERSRQIGGR
jgi:hypothetical protein